jgi:hypothetical protein
MTDSARRGTSAFIALLGLLIVSVDGLSPGTHSTDDIIGAGLFLAGTLGWLQRS